jgi:hypothetical protein
VKRREFITLIGGAAAWPLAARAQAKVYAIGILETVPPAQNQANFAALLNGLRELGYVEGRNLHIDYRSADGQGERFPELVAELEPRAYSTFSGLCANVRPGRYDAVLCDQLVAEAHRRLEAGDRAQARPVPGPPVRPGSSICGCRGSYQNRADSERFRPAPRTCRYFRGNLSVR